MKDKCSQCGVCCKLFVINLTQEEYKSKKYKTQFEELGLTEDAKESEILGTHEMSFKEAELCGENIITQKQDGSCIYLKQGKCSIHNIRPESCRKFFCTSKDPGFKSMIEKIGDYK